MQGSRQQTDGKAIFTVKQLTKHTLQSKLDATDNNRLIAKQLLGNNGFHLNIKNTKHLVENLASAMKS